MSQIYEKTLYDLTLDQLDWTEMEELEKKRLHATAEQVAHVLSKKNVSQENWWGFVPDELKHIWDSLSLDAKCATILVAEEANSSYDWE